MEKVQWCAAQHSMDARDHVGLVAPTRCRINLHDLDTVIFLVEKLGCGMSIRKLASNFQNQKCKFLFIVTCRVIVCLTFVEVQGKIRK